VRSLADDKTLEIEKAIVSMQLIMLWIQSLPSKLPVSNSPGTASDVEA
jgi:hypothetical protein